MHNKRDRKALLRIVSSYAMVAAVWILVSDFILGETLKAAPREILFHILKGLFFVALTAYLLHALIRRFLGERLAQDIEFAAITEQAREGILICDAQLRVLYANRAMVDITGYRLEETRGQPVSLFLPEGAASQLAAHVAALATLPFLRQDWQVRHKDGHRIDLELITQRLPGGRYLAMGTDVSAIRSAQRTAEIERERLSALLRAIPDPVWLKNTEGRYIACNPAVEQALNRPADMIIGHTDEELHTSADSEDFLATDRHVIATRQMSTFEQAFPLPDGTVAHFETTKSPVFSAQGDLYGVVGIARNITRERLAHAALQASERRFRILFEHASEMLLVSDENGRFITVNRRACETFGYSREEFRELSVFDINPEMTREQFERSWDSLLTDGSISFRSRDRHKDGHLIPVEVKVTKLLIDGQRFALAQLRDITRLEEAEAQLRQKKELNAAIINAMPAQMAVTDREGTIIQANHAWRLFALENAGNSEWSLGIGDPHIGVNFFTICDRADDAERQQAQAAGAGLRAVLAGGIPRFAMESVCRTANDERWFILNISPLHQGEAGALLAYTEITHIKQAQLLPEKFRQQLQALARRHLDIQESERHRLSMELHDQVSQALTALKISLFTAQVQVADEPRRIDSMLSATRAIDEIASTIRDIARRLRPPLLDQLGLGAGIHWHIENLPALDDTRIHFDNRIGQRRFPPDVELTAFRFVQEAITNAIRHARASLISISITIDGSQLRLEVKDDGEGFDVDHHERTNERNSLGLLGIRERIGQQNGTVSIASQANAGTLLSANIPIGKQTHETH